MAGTSNPVVARVGALEPDSSSPRLEPLSWSWNPLVWLAAALYRIATRGTATPVWVIFARAPGLLIAHLTLLGTAEAFVRLDERLRSLVRVFGSRVNGCQFCDDLEGARALHRRVLMRGDLDELASYRTSDRFSASEKAALAYVEEINTTRVVSPDTFATLRAHFTERQIVHITWLNAVGSYLNLQAKPLGLASEGYCAIAAR